VEAIPPTGATLVLNAQLRFEILLSLVLILRGIAFASGYRSGLVAATD
jgi:hypothetical protein